MVRVALVAFVVLVAAPAWTAEFERGMAAMGQGDFASAMAEWAPLAEAGHPRAQNGLGILYANGFGVARDYGRALAWFRRAAVQGLPDAQNNVGRHYRFGLGIGADAVEAARWIKRAARAGYVPAQGTLGAMYASGEGVPKDLLRAYFWWSLAAAEGDRPSMIAREDAAGLMTAHQIRIGNLLAEGWRREPATTGP
jgi:TPR repeat protein